MSGGVDPKREHSPWSAITGHDRQCPGPRGQLREGEQVLMSQSGSAPRPASHRSPKASPEEAVSSPRPSQPSPQASILSRDDSQAPTQGPGGAGGSVVRTEEGGRPASPGARTSDVHGMLNAPEPRHPRYPGGMAAFPGHPGESQSPRPPVLGATPHGQGASPFNPYDFQSQQTPATAQAGYPPLAPESLQALPAPNAQRDSPTIGQPLPPLGMPRRILTPRSPRVTSLSRAARRNEELLQNPLPRQPSVPEVQDVSPRSRPAVLRAPAPRTLPPSHTFGTALPPPSLSPVTSRSLSQPIVGHTFPASVQSSDYLHSTNRPPLPGSAAARTPSQPLASNTPPGGPGATETRWSTGNYGSLAGLSWGRGLPVGESQHLLTITPQYGEEIVVPVDTHQGSKTQDQKRQKNAIASARFRTRKKEREHQLEVDNHELGLRVRELEAEREFYRSERNRLRDIVARTPSISHWANGPPSPVPTRGVQGSFAAEGGTAGPGGQPVSNPGGTSPATRRRRGAPQARSPPRAGVSYTAESSTVASAPRHQGHTSYTQPPAYSYGAPEPSMAEPPARRRRIEHEPQFTTPTYGPPPPTLPPMAAQPAYSLNPPRHAPTSPGLPRLPPLRMSQPSPGAEHPPQPQPGAGVLPPPPQQTQQQEPDPLSYSRSYETTWSQGPQARQEGGQR